MNKDTALIKENIENIITSQFSANLKDKINTQIDFINLFYNRIKKFQENNDLKIEYVIAFNKITAELIEEKHNSNLALNFNEKFDGLVVKLNEYLNTFDETIIELQSDERFKFTRDDPYFIKNAKRFKRLFLKISQVPISAGNFFRKIFKKELKSKKNWGHTIPVKNISLIILRDRLCKSLFPVIEEVNLDIASSSYAVWQIDEKINKSFIDNVSSQNEEFKSLTQELDNTLKNLHDKIDLLDKKVLEILESAVEEFKEVYEKAGTIELPKRKFSSNKVNASNKKLNEHFKTIDEGWQNSYFALFEDWRLNKELYIVSGQITQVYADIRKGSEERIDLILSELKKAFVLLKDIEVEISEFYGSSSELISLLYKEKEKIYKRLAGKLIPGVSEIILAQNIPELVGGIELNIEDLVQNLSKKRAVIKTGTYTRKVRTSEIDYISPNEMISFISLTRFSKSIQRVKNKILREIQKVQNSISDIDQISDFNLDTAISMFHNDERTGEDPLDIAVEGIERAIGKTGEIEKTLLSINKEIEETIGSSINDFKNDLIKLTKAENLLDIKIKIAKEKALQRTGKLKERSVVWIKNFIPILRISYEKGQGSYKDFYSFIRKKLGLTPKLETISSEISDFLAATQTAVLKLPVVYRRLFEIEALKDERFFEGRGDELSRLDSAFENWKSGGFAPVAIIGEKGSGATTLLNFFEIRIETKYNILRTEITNAVYKKEVFEGFLKAFLNINSTKNFEELIVHLNNQPAKRIIIIENIQHLFLRKVNGFLCLKILFEIISKTQKNIFWITTASLYSWEYLNKTLNIADYFGYVIRLKSIEDEQMVRVILKRHKISGYNLSFKPSKEEEMSKSYTRIPDEKKQEYLSRQYFSDLNKFAKSNISLALLFWLRSTQEVSGDTITIGSLRDIDFSFLSSLETSKVFTLHSLLIHDGLTIESFTQTNNLPDSQCRAMFFVLLDDGIIVQRNGLYKINPLLYRQIVNILQTKNIIH